MIVNKSVAKTTPLAISSLLICKSPRKTTKLRIDPKAINFPNCPLLFKIDIPSIKSYSVKSIIKR